jgi:hypothetical protein
MKTRSTKEEQQMQKPRVFSTQRGLFGFYKDTFDPQHLNNKLNDREYEEIIDATNKKLVLFDLALNALVFWTIYNYYIWFDARLTYEAGANRSRYLNDAFSGLNISAMAIENFLVYFTIRLVVLCAAGFAVRGYMKQLNSQFSGRGLSFECGRLAGTISIKAQD